MIGDLVLRYIDTPIKAAVLAPRTMTMTFTQASPRNHCSRYAYNNSMSHDCVLHGEPISVSEKGS
ncbi:MAG: hypothetical protein QGM46_11530, partial [Actinomycetota bacterium]|nr:hypothetical protein [Actinomycetota bacterium]